ncbi:pyridoxal phosphate-dependent transferase [Suillus subluteus]|nr:pyridoxal phosphate-dependent transferase [Suillus subluteus]
MHKGHTFNREFWRRQMSVLETIMPNLAMTTSAHSLVTFGQQYVARGLGRLTEAVMAKGEGSCGISVTNLGHCHPKVSKAAADQCVNIVHAQCSISFHGPYLCLIKKLLPIMPDPSLDLFFFWNSGSEAIEVSLKMAQQITGQQNIIGMQGGYHGRTFGAMALTKSKTIYHEGSFPLMPGVFTIPFPYWHQLGLPINTSEEELFRLSLYQLDLVLKQQTAPRDTAAIIVEPVLGEGGYVPASASFLKGLRAVCDKHSILLIVDETEVIASIAIRVEKLALGPTNKSFNKEGWPILSTTLPDKLPMALLDDLDASNLNTRKQSHIVVVSEMKPFSETFGLKAQNKKA